MASVFDAIKGGYVTGIQDGRVLPRLEVDEFASDKDLLNIFLLGVQSLQSRDATDPWSWFQIAGIHGEPAAPWDKVDTLKRVQGSGPDAWAGYCSHSSVTFPTWHRPFVAMMEQAIYAEMLEIASQYPSGSYRQRYQDACTRYRFPYWDPCIPRQRAGVSISNSMSTMGVPMIAELPTVFVRRPQAPDQLVPLDNPLFAYQFPSQQALRPVPGTQNLFHHFDDRNPPLTQEQLNTNRRQTARAPDSRGRSHNEFIDDQLTRRRQEFGTSVYSVLTSPNDWSAFSNDANESRKMHQSIEGFHDNIHGLVGQSAGHMNYPQYAAFDPIFWLHHCNVDRLIALWQASRGESAKFWWTSRGASEANRFTNPDAALTPDGPLVPFRRSARSPPDDLSNLHTSASCRDWTTLGYTYLLKRVVNVTSDTSTGSQQRLRLTPTSLKFRGTSPADYNTYVNQFYQWLTVPSPQTPDLLRQFYPIDLTTAEAVSGRALSVPKVLSGSPVPTTSNTQTTDSLNRAPAGTDPLMAKSPDLQKPAIATSPIARQQSAPAPQISANAPNLVSSIPDSTISTSGSIPGQIPNLSDEGPTVIQLPHAPAPVRDDRETVAPLPSDVKVAINLPSYPDRLSDSPRISCEIISPHTIDYTAFTANNCLDSNNGLRQWDLRIVAEEFAYTGTYSVVVFLGPWNTTARRIDPSREPNLVHIDTIFANNVNTTPTTSSEYNTSSNCANCDEQAQSQLGVLEIVPITQYLIQWIMSKRPCPPEGNTGIILHDLGYDNVNAFLAKNLHWRVVNSDFVILDDGPDHVKLEAVDRMVKLPTRFDEAIVYEEPEDRGTDKTASAGQRPTPAHAGGAYAGGSAAEKGDGYDRSQGQSQATEVEDGRPSSKKFCGLPCIIM